MDADVYFSDRAADARLNRDRNGNGNLVIVHGCKRATVFKRAGWFFAVADTRKKYRDDPPRIGGPFPNEDAAYAAALKDVRGY